MKIRISSSVSNFKDKILKNWPVEEYIYPQDIEEPVCFFGMYHDGDYSSFINHRGKKMIFWCGSDINNIKTINSKYVLGTIFLSYYKNVCENTVERNKLEKHGIDAEIHPTFAGDISKYKVCYKPKAIPEAWCCMHEGREKEYGLNIIKDLAHKNGRIYHIYGIEGDNEYNLIYHGQVPEEQLDEDIKDYQVALRLNKFEGFSEVVAKGILLGQKIESRIKYKHLDNRKYWVKKLTDFKWLKI